MSWFKKKEKMIKTASKKEDAYFSRDTDTESKNQVAQSTTVFNIQRYVFDSYTVKIAFSKTKDKFSVSILCNHAFLGTITWDQYWFYNGDEFEKAKGTYDKIKKIVTDLMTKFVDEEIPTPMFWAYLKKEAEEVDPDGTYRSNIPLMNYSHQYRHLASPDWRSNIYGNRYPKQKEISFRQYYKNLWTGIK